MKRRLKDFARRHLPRALVLRVKRLLSRNTPALDLPAVHAEEVAGGYRCTVGEGVTFLLPAACQPDIDFARTDEGRAELAGIARLAQRGGTLFDIGANAGIISALFCGAAPGNRAVCFEPSPQLQRRLEDLRTLGGLEARMQIEGVAIGEKAATVTMLVDPVGGFVQSQRFAHSMTGEPEEIPLQIETIPAAVARLGIVPDFIKIDIEGYEYEAVSGALEFLAQRKPTLLFEIHLNYLEERQLSPRTLIGMLEGCGYRFFDYAGHAIRPREIYDSLQANVRFYCE